MKILYFYQYFSTPKGSWGTRVYEFTKEWVELGHDVTVVTSIYSKSDLVANRLIENQIFDGIKVKVINVKLDNRQSTIKRIWTFVLYMLIACWYALKIKADVVIASSGPITIGLPGLLSRIRSKKFVFEVRDLWPEGAVTMGIIKSKIIIKIAYWFEDRCYKKADYIITLSKGIEENIKKRLGYNNISSIPNGANLDLFYKNANIEVNEFHNKIVAIYTGNIGQVNNSNLLLEAATILHDGNNNEVHILMVGEGQLRESIENEIKKRKLTNISIKKLMPKSELIQYIQASTVSLVPLDASTIWDTSSPNKLFESLACGIPVIQTTSGWIKQMLSETESGFSVSPKSPKELANLLSSLNEQTDLLQRMGENAIQLAHNEFDKNKLSLRMINLISNIVNE